MDIINELVSVIVRLVIAGAGTAFMAYGIPYLKKIGVYKLVQIAVRAAEKLGATGAIEKADKKKYETDAKLKEAYAEGQPVFMSGEELIKFRK